MPPSSLVGVSFVGVVLTTLLLRMDKSTLLPEQLPVQEDGLPADSLIPDDDLGNFLIIFNLGVSFFVPF